MKYQMSWNVKCHKISNVMKCWCWIYDPNLGQAETPGVTHFGAYHRPPDGHFCQKSQYRYLSPIPVYRRGLLLMELMDLHPMHMGLEFRSANVKRLRQYWLINLLYSILSSVTAVSHKLGCPFAAPISLQLQPRGRGVTEYEHCLLYTSDAADE